MRETERERERERKREEERSSNVLEIKKEGKHREKRRPFN